MRDYAASSTLIHFDEFVRTHDPSNTTSEMAALRALIVEFRQSLEIGTAERAQQFFTAVEAGLALAVSMLTIQNPHQDPEPLDQLAARALEEVKLQYSLAFPISSRISAKEAEVMAKMIKMTVDAAEKYRKILDSSTLLVRWDNDLLRTLEAFVRHILPAIHPEDRAAVMDRASSFVSGSSEVYEQEALTDGGE